MADLVTTDYYYGHGEANAGKRSALGVVTDYDIALPEINSVSLSIEKEDIRHDSKRQAIASTDLIVTRMMRMTGTINCSVHTAAMLSVYLYGNVSAISGGSFTAATFPLGVAATNRLPIPGDRTNISSLVLTDSAGSPATLVAGSDYEVDLNAGIVKFINLGSYVQPFKAAGTEAPSDGVGLLTQRVVERAFRFSLINVADGDKRCILDLYRCHISPAATWNLLNDGTDVNTYEISFEVMKDATKDPLSTFGQFGRYRQIT